MREPELTTGRLTIGIVVRVNDAAGGVEVGESALIRAVKRGGTPLDNESLLGWPKGAGSGAECLEELESERRIVPFGFTRPVL